MDKFVENSQFNSHSIGSLWATYVYSVQSPGMVGEAECAVRCLLSNKDCHFYVYKEPSCYFGDFSTPKQSYVAVNTIYQSIMYIPGSFGKLNYHN